MRQPNLKDVLSEGESFDSVYITSLSVPQKKIEMVFLIHCELQTL